MVRKSAKGYVLGKEKKLSLIAEGKKALVARRQRDDKRWKKVLAKMSAEKKKKYSAMTKVARRGATRRSLRPEKPRKADTVSYEMTIHLAKLVKGRTFHKRAPTAIKKVRAFAKRVMKTKDNRIEATLNNFLWNRGVKGCPTRVRVQISRKVAESQEGKGGKRKHLYSVISHVPTKTFKGLLTKPVVKAAKA